MSELATLTATQMLTGYRRHEFTPSEVTQAVLERADALQPQLNCFSLIRSDEALATAHASDARWRTGDTLGLIDGVPATVKENVAIAGVPRPSGTAATADALPETDDGPISARIRESGAPLFGVTVMPDWGMLSSGVSSLHGITRSPWNLGWTVGGSSSGAGSAAAGRIGPLHTGSDIGGSLRLPATWLGLVTLKPSFGRVPVDPPYMGRCAGPLTRDVADTVLFMKVLAQPDWRDYTSLGEMATDWDAALEFDTDTAMRGKRIAVHTDAGAGMPTDPEVAALIRRAAQTFADAGAIVEEIPPFITPDLLHSLDVFLRVRSWSDFAHLEQERRARVLPFIQDWVLGGADKAGTRVLEYYQDIQAMRKTTIAATHPYDLVLSPVAPVAAFPAEWPMPTNDPDTSMHHIAFTAPYNFSEQPASSVNCGFTSDGRPVGVQIAGHRFDDIAVLQATAWFERARSGDAVPDWP